MKAAPLDLLLFIAVWFFCGLIQKVKGIAALTDKLLDEVNNFLKAKQPFENSSPLWEERKLFILQSIALLTLASRLIEVCRLQASNHNFGLLLLDSIATALCFLAFTPKFRVPALFLLAMSLNTVLDPLNHTGSLGSMVASLLLWFFALHAHNSSKSSKSVAEMTSSERLNLSRLLLFLGYSLLCLYSGLDHVLDVYWQKGTTSGLLLLSASLNPHTWRLAASAYEYNPSLYLLLSKFATWNMLLWFLGLPVFVFLSKPTRLFAIGLGLIFFTIDAFLLPLIGNLGLYHFCLWAVLFLPCDQFQYFTRFSYITRFLKLIDRACTPSASWSSFSILALQNSFVLLACVLGSKFLLNLPIVPSIPQPSILDLNLSHHPESALGLGDVNVFNSTDIQSSRQTLTITAVGKAVELRLQNFTLSDATRLKWLIATRRSSDSRLWAYNIEHDEAIAALTSEIGSRYPWAKFVEIAYAKSSLPSWQELTHAKFIAPNISKPTCNISIAVSSKKVVKIEFFQSGLDYFWLDMPYSINAEVANSRLPSFPAYLEQQLFWDFVDRIPPVNAQKMDQRAFKMCLKQFRFGNDPPPPYVALEDLLLTYHCIGLNITDSCISAIPTKKSLAEELRSSYIAALHNSSEATIDLDSVRKKYFSELIMPKTASHEEDKSH